MRRSISLLCIISLFLSLFVLPAGISYADPLPSDSLIEASPAVYEELQIGDKGDLVQALQERLIDLNYQIGSADGVFGKKTETAIKRIQILASLEVTGVADQATQEFIWSEDSDISDLIIQPTPEPTPEPTPTPEPLTNDNADYILNRNTKKFHETWCSSVDQMSEKNKIYFHGTSAQAKKKGYVPCKRCNP